MQLGPVMLDIVGTELTDTDKALLQHPATGGVIFFSRNFESSDQIYRLSKQIHELRSPALLIAVDQEGGRVQRFKEGFTRLPPAAAFYRHFDEDLDKTKQAIHETSWLMASELIAVGIDFSFAPVLDLNFGLSSVIGDRAFADTAELVSELASAWAEGAREAGMISVGKHFPGHGGVVEDSHLALPIDKRSLSDIEEHDLKPFKALINEGLEGVMPAHVIYETCDDQPAGFSQYWLQNVLREQLGFDGVIFSDDLSMEGANQAGSYPERGKAALDAGCDMVLVCNNPDGAKQVTESLNDYQNAISRKRLLKLQAKQGMTMSELKETSRWQSANALVSAIIEE